ncbi:MAG: reverse transcriptase domain-containing protein, partial [Prevotella sp.]
MTYEEIVCDANNLYKAYKASVKGSKWKETTQKFMMNFLRYIFSIQEDIINRNLRNGKTDEFSLSERGRVRPITSLQTKDRIIRHVLCDEALLPEVKKHIIYDNGASIKGRGISHSRKRFEVHLHKYYRAYGNEGYILFGDFSKFYDNIIHEIAKKELLKLFDDDEFIDWLLTLIFHDFRIDVSYMSDEEYENCMTDTFNKLEYRLIPKELLTGEKWMDKSVNIGDQLSQIIGIYYPYRIDNYVKYVRSQKFYGRYMDDWYIMNPNKKELQDLLGNIRVIADELGIHINEKKTHIVKISSTYKYLQVKYTLTE